MYRYMYTDAYLYIYIYLVFVYRERDGKKERTTKTAGQQGAKDNSQNQENIVCNWI